MTWLDWLVLAVTILGIAAWGAWKNRAPVSSRDYLKGSDDHWTTVGLSIMATQASAITFLSVPGQAYEDGMGFVQFYFGMPLAMVVICAVFVPIYHRLQVVTAYEYLEERFDGRVRALAATLFLIGRGLAAGISIYAPSILLSSVLGWSLNTLNVLIGSIVIAYTVTGGAKAVSQTNRQQMSVILGGIVVAAVVIAWRLPDGVGPHEAATLAGAVGRMQLVDLSLDPNSRYTLWSGLTGGFFLSLSYFGTDQSQVGRYLSGRSMAHSRLGLLFNGLLKIPMQALILFIGILLFVFYVFERPPLFFDAATVQRVEATEHAGDWRALEARWDGAFTERRDAASALLADDTQATREAFVGAQARMDTLRGEGKDLVKLAVPSAETKDADYIFVSFVLRWLPPGIVGLLLAVILLASMSTTASELSSLGATTTVDLYRRWLAPKADERHLLLASQAWTAAWGLVAIAFATFASMVDNLIQAVNILGSIFYGVILGIFVVGFFLRWIGALPVLIAAIFAEAVVIGLYVSTDIGFLWFNVIGCGLVVGLAMGVQLVTRSKPAEGVT